MIQAPQVDLIDEQSLLADGRPNGAPEATFGSILCSMFTRITINGGRSYLQIMESFRNEAGNPRVRVVANLGRVDEIKDGQFDALIRGLSRAAGRAEPAKTEISYESARGYGDVFALHELWKDLGFDRALRRALRSGRRGFDAEALIRAMAFNRLCAPDSKLGCLRWLETVAIPAMPETVTHQQLLRAMDALMDHAEIVERELAQQIRRRGVCDHD